MPQQLYLQVKTVVRKFQYLVNFTGLVCKKGTTVLYSHPISFFFTFLMAHHDPVY